MTLREMILAEHSKPQTMRIVQYVGDSPERFGELMALFIKGEPLVTQRAAWPISYCAEAYPALAKPYMRKMLTMVKKDGIHNAVRRNILKIWESNGVPQKLEGEVYDLCFGFLRSLDEHIAVKAISMTILENICKKHPELREELYLVVADMMPFAPPAIRSRGKKILKGLQKV